MFSGINHVGIAVKKLEEAIQLYDSLFGTGRPTGVTEWPELGIREANIPVGKQVLSFMEPISPQSEFNRFLERRGEGLHHVSLEIHGLDQYLVALERKGVPIIGRGQGWASVHPRAAKGVWIELLENEVTG